MDNLLAILPSILALGAFIWIIRLILHADRLERRAEQEFEARESRESLSDTTNPER